MAYETYHILYQVVPKKYLLLPSQTVLQDDYLRQFRRGPRYKVNYIPQQDGSRLKCLVSEVPMNYLAEILEKQYNIPVFTPKEGLDVLDSDISGHMYRLYWTHTFLNGARCLPILIHPFLPFYWDLVPFFTKYQIKNSYGILLPFNADGPITTGITLQDQYIPSIIPYMSKYRLCHHCGRVCDVTYKPKTPWAELMQENKIN